MPDFTEVRDYESDFGTSVQGDEDVNFRIPTKLPQALALAEEVASRYFEEGVTFPASALWAGKQSLGTHCLGIASLVCRLFWVTLRLTIVVRAEVRCLVARMCGIMSRILVLLFRLTKMPTSVYWLNFR